MLEPRPLRFYFAARFQTDTRPLVALAEEIAADSGWTCNSRWLDPANHGLPPQQIAAQDLDDVAAADAVVASLQHPSSSGGLWWECGYAAGRGKPVVMLQPPHVTNEQLPPFASLAWRLQTVGAVGAVLRALGDYPRAGEDYPQCRGCGCTDITACTDPHDGRPCYWVVEDLCSVCAFENGTAHA